LLAAAVIAGLVGGGLGAGVVLYWTGAGGGATVIKPAPPADDHSPVRPSRVSVLGGDAIVEANRRVAPAVVRVETVTVESRPMSPFDRLFGGPRPRLQAGVGSGVVFEYEGKHYVLTNHHVVGDARYIELHFQNGAKHEGQVVNSDPQEDLAVVRIEGGGRELPAATFGNSDDVQVGQWVVAIGSPYGLQQTSTVGIVSATGWLRVGEETWRNRIQTDAAINQGNSGGPLIDLAGNVIGINQVIYSPTGATVGIGFAIPSNIAQEMLYYLVHRGPWIGVSSVVPNSAGLAAYLGLGVDEGVLVYDTYPGGPADEAGVRAGDVILSVEGAETNSPEALTKAIRKLKIGDAARIEVDRQGQRRTIDVKTGRIPAGTR
jgi:S1-C subfamily serine protease